MSRLFCQLTSQRAYSTRPGVHLWDRLPGEGTAPTKGVERLLGLARAKRFAEPCPVSATLADRFDVAISKMTLSSYSLIFRRAYIHVCNSWRGHRGFGYA